MTKQLTAKVTQVLLTIVMISAVLFSSLAAAQPPTRGGGSGYPRAPEQPTPGNNLAPPTQEAAPSVSRQQAMNLVRDSFQGRVLSVRTDGGNWRVRVDQNGTVFNVFVDGRTGEVNRSPE